MKTSHWLALSVILFARTASADFLMCKLLYLHYPMDGSEGLVVDSEEQRAPITSYCGTPSRGTMQFGKDFVSVRVDYAAKMGDDDCPGSPELNRGKRFILSMTSDDSRVPKPRYVHDHEIRTDVAFEGAFHTYRFRVGEGMISGKPVNHLVLVCAGSN